MNVRLLVTTVLLSLSTALFATEDIRTLEAELRSLEQQLPSVLQEAELAQREAYVARVLALRERLLALEQQQSQRGDSPATTDSGEHIYFLSDMVVEEATVHKKAVSRKGSAGVGYTIKRRSGPDNNGPEQYTIQRSVGHATFPQKIILGKPFSFTVTAAFQADWNEGGYCRLSSFGKDPGVYAAFELRDKYGRRFHHQFTETADFKRPGCPKGSKTRSPALAVGNSVEADIQCQPDGKEERKTRESHDHIYRYACAIRMPDGTRRNEQLRLYWPLMKSESGGWVLDKKDIQAGGALSFSVGGAGHAVLKYRREPTHKPIATAGYTHPFDIRNRIGNSGDARPAGSDRDGADIASSPAGQAGRRQSGSDQDATAQRHGHITHWLQHAEPIENARPGYQLRYDRWGRVQGQTPNGRITVSGKPDAATGFADANAYLWTVAAQKQSLNLCTLQEYVERKLNGRETASCQKSALPKAPATAKNAVPDYSGYTAASAQADLKQRGIKIKWQAGSVPDDPAKSGTIEKQQPVSGSSLATTQSITLWVYRKVANTVQVPNVFGMPYRTAVSRLNQAGLKAQVGDALPPRSRTEAGKVIKQHSKAGMTVAAGSAVVLDIAAGGGATTTMPDVVGLDYNEAARKLSAAGLKPMHVLGPYAPSAGQARKVKGTSFRNGTPVNIGSEVSVTVYNIYSSKTAPTEPATVVKRDPAPAFAPGANAGGVPRFMNCDLPISGFRALRGSSGSKAWGETSKPRADGLVDYGCRYKRANGDLITVGARLLTRIPPGMRNNSLVKSACKQKPIEDDDGVHTYAAATAGKAVSISVNQWSASSRWTQKILTSSQLQTILNFHLKQMLPHAASCP